MDRSHAPAPTERDGRRVSRRSTVLGLGAAAVAAALGPVGPTTPLAAAQIDGAAPAATPTSPRMLTDDVVRAFEADVAAAMGTFRVPGAAVVLVEGDRVVFSRGFGVRDLQSDAPVTTDTRFRIASNTKSMTSLLVATFVDEGVLGWDDRVADVWPGFRAPTAELTAGLRVRDLMGMATGIAEPATIEFFVSSGDESAADLLRSVPFLPTIGPPNAEYFYNNSLVCVAGYLRSLAEGMAPDALEPAYAALVAERVFGPIGMANAAIADDPRRLGDDYAVGHTRDLFGRLTASPFVSLGGTAPAGSGLASGHDMARYVIAQMNGGVAPGGDRVVSAANLAETHRPGIAVPDFFPAPLLTDTTGMRYCLGWFEQTFTDGRRLLWHAGGIDGFGSLMGFFPEERIGFAFLTNLEPSGGSLLNLYLQSILMNRLFGLNGSVAAYLSDVVPTIDEQNAALAARTRPVDPTAVGPVLGLYGDGFRLRLDEAGVLRLDHDIRSLPLLALADGSYVVANGPDVIRARTVTLAAGADGLPVMTIEGFDPVRWLTGA